MKPRCSRWRAWGWVCSLALIVSSMVLIFPTKSWAIPAFARMYGLQCSTCHSAFPALNDQGEEFRISGYRRFSRGEVVPIVPNIKIGERLDLPAIFPISTAVQFGYNFRQIHNTLADGQVNVSPDPEFRRTDHGFDLNGMDFHVGTPMGSHLSFFISAPIASTGRREFWDKEISSKGLNSDLSGPDVPDLLFLEVNDIFVKDLFNLKAGNFPLMQLGFSPDSNRMSFFPYMVNTVTALDIFTDQPIERFRQVGTIDPGTFDDRNPILGSSQVGLQVFGRVTPALHKVPGLYVDYATGVVNGTNVHPANRPQKDGFAQLLATYPIAEHLSMRLGGFGYYSGNILDSRTINPDTGLHYKDRMWRVGPQISFTLSDPLYAKVFSQVLFGRDNNLTGFGKRATWWGGYVQAEAKLLGEWPIIGYARYDWINADRYNDSNVTINGANGIIGPVHPRLWDAVVGVQYFVYENLKVIAEYRHGEKRLRPGTSDNPGVTPDGQLSKTTEDAVMTGFHIGF